MEKNQTQKVAKKNSQKEETNITLNDQTGKRQRKAVYLDEETIKLLEIVKAISSYTKTQDTVIIKRALEYVIFNRQDLNDVFEKLATLIDIEKINKKHIGKFNAAFEIFQSEAFQSQQFTQQLLKQISEQLKEILERSNLPV